MSATQDYLREISTLHDTRHTHNSLLVPHIGIKVLQERMGWSDPTMMLKTYTHTNSEQRREAAEKFEEIIKAARNGTDGTASE